MPVSTLRRQRKNEVHEQLISVGYSIVNHNQNRLQIEMMLQICINHIADLTGQPVEKVFHSIFNRKYKVENYARTNKAGKVARKIDLRTVCLLYGNPEENVHNVQESCTPYTSEDTDNNTNVVVDQTNKPDVPDDISSEDS